MQGLAKLILKKSPLLYEMNAFRQGQLLALLEKSYDRPSGCKNLSCLLWQSMSQFKKLLHLMVSGCSSALSDIVDASCCAKKSFFIIPFVRISLPKRYEKRFSIINLTVFFKAFFLISLQFQSSLIS